MKVRISLVLGIAVALALPAFASAASLPKNGSTLIVPAKSLGGVKLNSSLSAAIAVWGKGASCSPSGCEYGSASGPNGTASLLAGKLTETSPVLVVSVTIGVGRIGTTAKPSFKTPLTRYRTASGIGIGSTVKELRHAYSHLISEEGKVFTLKGAGESSSTFVAENGRVETITIQSVHLG